MTTLWVALIGLLTSAVVLFMLLPHYAIYRGFAEKRSIVLLVTFFSITAGGLYYVLGDSRGMYNKMLWQQIEAADTHTSHNAPLQVPENFIASLELQLQERPDNGLNWILLGRIYFSAQDYHDAANAFKQAFEIYPQDPDILVEYAASLYLAGENNGEAWESVLAKVESLSPQTTMSLSLLGNMAYESGNHAQAVIYWQTLLAMTPQESPLYQTLQKTIADVSVP